MSLSWSSNTPHAYEDSWRDPWKDQPAGYGKPRMTDTVGLYWVCEKCGSSVGNAGVEIHDAWHERIGF